MKSFDALKLLLEKVKEKLNFESIEELNKSLEDYGSDPDIVKIKELMVNMTFDDIKSKFMLISSLFHR
jgi:hypothetical protein